jgi:hypothetical protein
LSQPPDSPSLSEAQLATLAEIGEERTANAGDVLYRVGDRDYPVVAIIDGAVAILDAAGNEIARREAMQQVGDLGLEILGPRSSPATLRVLECARSTSPTSSRRYTRS